MSSFQKIFSQHFLATVIILQVIMYLSLFLNIPLAREVVGLVYLTFVPGLVVVKLLRLDGMGSLEAAVFSVGFSLAFLMLAGLMINQFGYLAGLTFPLATLPLSLFINTLVIVGAGVAYLRQPRVKQPLDVQGSRFGGFSLSYILLAIIPVTAVIGAYFVNTTGNNFILIVMILSIAALFTFSALYERPAKFYPFAIFMIALALLLHVSLITNYIVPYGGDSPAEFYVFQNTQLNAQWTPVFPFAMENLGRFNAMLSITVLPTVYSNMLGLDPTLVIKIIYPILFAVVPVALYMLWEPYVGKKLSFLAAFLFVAQSTFFTEMIAINRQMIAEIFFVLLLVLLLNKKIKTESKFIGFAFLGFGLIFSHYALSEIFLLLALAAWVVSVFYIRKPSFNLGLTTIIFFFVAMFAWYIYTSGAVVFNSFMTFTGYVTGQLGEFLNPAARGATVLTGVGLTESPSILNTVSRGFAYLTEIFIVIGVIALLRNKLHFKFDRDFKVFTVLTLVILVALIAVPGLANTLNMTRFYHILLMFLAPFGILGMWVTAEYVSKFRKKAVFTAMVIIILVPYFLFQTNFVYEVAQTESWSIPLSSYRMEPLAYYGEFGMLESYSVYGAEWASGHVAYQYNIAADNGLYTALTAYGGVYPGYVTPLNNITWIHSGQFIYLSYITINYEKEYLNGTIPLLLNQTDVVYSNGGSEVQFVPYR